jgi:hypothetical protein
VPATPASATSGATQIAVDVIPAAATCAAKSSSQRPTVGRSPKRYDDGEERALALLQAQEREVAPELGVLGDREQHGERGGEARDPRARHEEPHESRPRERHEGREQRGQEELGDGDGRQVEQPGERGLQRLEAVHLVDRQQDREPGDAVERVQEQERRVRLVHRRRRHVHVVRVVEAPPVEEERDERADRGREPERALGARIAPGVRRARRVAGPRARQRDRQGAEREDPRQPQVALQARRRDRRDRERDRQVDARDRAGRDLARVGPARLRGAAPEPAAPGGNAAQRERADADRERGGGRRPRQLAQAALREDDRVRDERPPGVERDQSVAGALARRNANPSRIHERAA